MVIEIGADRERRGLVEKNPHLGGVFGASIETANGEFNYGLDLFTVQPFIPLHDVIDVRAGFEVFEDGRHRHPGALQHPRAAYLAGNAFDRGTL
jgi:hypothetical protein